MIDAYHIVRNRCTSGSGNARRRQEHRTAIGLAALHLGNVSRSLSFSRVHDLDVSRDDYGPVHGNFM